MKINDIWESLKGSAQHADRQRFPGGSSEDHPNRNHLRRFLNTHLPGSGRAATEETE